MGTNTRHKRYSSRRNDSSDSVFLREPECLKTPVATATGSAKGGKDGMTEAARRCEQQHPSISAKLRQAKGKSKTLACTKAAGEMPSPVDHVRQQAPVNRSWKSRNERYYSYISHYSAADESLRTLVPPYGPGENAEEGDGDPRFVVRDASGNVIGTVCTVDDAECRTRMTAAATAGPGPNARPKPPAKPFVPGAEQPSAAPHVRAIPVPTSVHQQQQQQPFSRFNPSYHTQPATSDRRTRPAFLRGDPKRHTVHPTTATTASSSGKLVPPSGQCVPLSTSLAPTPHRQGTGIPRQKGRQEAALSRSGVSAKYPQPPVSLSDQDCGRRRSVARRLDFSAKASVPSLHAAPNSPMPASLRDLPSASHQSALLPALRDGGPDQAVRPRQVSFAGVPTIPSQKNCAVSSDVATIPSTWTSTRDIGAVWPRPRNALYNGLLLSTAQRARGKSKSSRPGIRARLLKGFPKEQIRITTPGLVFEGSFLSGGRASELRQSNRRYSFTAAVAPEEVIEDFYASGLVTSPPRGPPFLASSGFISTSDIDVDTDNDAPDPATASSHDRQPAQQQETVAVDGRVVQRYNHLLENIASADQQQQCISNSQNLSSQAPGMSSDRASTPIGGACAGDGANGAASNGDEPVRQSPVRSSSLIRAVSGEGRRVNYPRPAFGTRASLGCCEWTRQLLLWLIHGERGRLLTRVFLSILAWAVLATITGKAALPGPDGFLFAISVVIATAALCGYLVRLIRLPPLLGMLLAGFLLRNVSVVDVPELSTVIDSNLSNVSNVTMAVGSELTSNLRSSWSSALRSVALVIILVRAGLGLDPSVLKRAKFVILRLAFLPCLVETTVDAILARLLLDFPWAWGFILGFVIAAVSPAVVVPSLLGLQERGLGVAKGIPTLIIAAASFDDVIAISGFGIALGLVFSTGASLAFNIVRGPLELIAGIGGGTLVGVIAWYIPSSDKSGGHRFRNRILYLLFAGLTAVFGTRLVHFTGAGALGSLVMAFVAGQGWTNTERKKVAKAFALLWHFAQPMLFGLIGAEIDAKSLGKSYVGTAIGILWAGMLFRVVVSALSVTRYDLTLKEKLFVSLAWLPKATVQAAIGSLALDTATEQGGTAEQIELGRKVLTIAVLVIVFTAPIGSIAISLSGPRLLEAAVDGGEDSDLQSGEHSADRYKPDANQDGSAEARGSPLVHESAV